MTLGTYETFIAKSRYSRFLDDKHRREHWPETVDRYMNFMQKQLQKKHSYTMPPSLRDELHSAILNCEVMPSMRAMMTAGEALDRDNTAGYNCSYLPVDDVKSFDEAMYILLCGTGVGFSVESKYVNKLPEVPSKMFNSDTTIVVSDSKAGWAKALRQLVALLYSGEIPKWDTSKVRAAGARLKTFGGRASGPQPLISLFEFVTSKFKGAAGRKLTSLECHDIMCKIGEDWFGGSGLSGKQFSDVLNEVGNGPLLVEDMDRTFIDFVGDSNGLSISIDGKKIPVIFLTIQRLSSLLMTIQTARFNK